MQSVGIAASVVAAVANLLGAVAVTSRRHWSASALELMIALSAGFMLSVAIADIIPEAILQGGRAAGATILAGFLLVHVTQHVFVRHFHYGEETHVVERSVAGSALVGLLLHTLVDGVAIASAFVVNTQLGVLVFGAIALHKLPEGFAIASLVLAAGGLRRAAIGAAAVLGAATVLGVWLTGAIPALATHGLALAGGVTVYVGASNLIPEFQGKPGWRHTAAFVLGCVLYLAAHAVLPG
jgi:ZIP family zinc transporter/zinc and cadmium transporter